LDWLSKGSSMKYRIIYYYKGSQSPSSRIIEAKNEKDALAILQGASGSNPNYEITSVICESESVCSPSTQFNKQASESEAANKLTAYKSRQRLKEEKPMWFFTLDSEKIEGPVVLASIQNKVDKGILKEDSLVMKAGKDWMTVSEFKNMSIPFVASKPSPSVTHTRNAKASPVPTSGPSHRPNRAPYGNKDHKTSKRVDMPDELVKRSIQRGKSLVEENVGRVSPVKDRMLEKKKIQRPALIKEDPRAWIDNALWAAFWVAPLAVIFSAFTGDDPTGPMLFIAYVFSFSIVTIYSKF
jgi:hypothetical protein